MMLLLCLVNIVNMSSCVVEDAWRWKLINAIYSRK